jgi:hypothetical protein
MGSWGGWMKCKGAHGMIQIEPTGPQINGSSYPNSCMPNFGHHFLQGLAIMSTNVMPSKQDKILSFSTHAHSNYSSI